MDPIAPVWFINITRQSLYFESENTMLPNLVSGMVISFSQVQTCFFMAIINRIIIIMEGQVAVRLFLQYVTSISHYNNHLEMHKRRLAEAVSQIEDYIESFKVVDLDKRGKITQKVMQNYLISQKYYHEPTAISRFYSKYSHGKDYLLYEDLLEALLPSADYILVSHTLTNPSEYANRPAKFTYSCHRERVQSIHHFTAFILSEELKALGKDYQMMRNITKNSQRVGAILWRLLDRNHNNELNYQKVKISAEEVGLKVQQHEWRTFLYWHFHSYKQTISRDDFMRVLDAHEQRKRATSACRIDQFKVQQQLFKLAEQERARNLRIKKAVEEKLAMIPLISKEEYLSIMRQEHLPYELLDSKRELRGKKGYSNPKNMIKYAIQRP